ncbi:MAG TPA: hypothetical protein VIU40_14665 [Geobacteraceae bacterium]
MAAKKMRLTFYRQNHLRNDWQVDMQDSGFELFFIEMADDLARFGIELERAENYEVTIDVNSYADVLNAVRISSPADGLANVCVGHAIGKSPNLDIYDDIRRAVNRVAFAPETIAPDEHNRRVCHNCGCGC